MKTTLKAKEFINGLMAENMKVNGKTTKWKDMAFLHGQMVENMKEST
jgi:predicted ATPase